MPVLHWVVDVGCSHGGCYCGRAYVAVQGGITPIYIAAHKGHRECIEVLGQLGGDVNKAWSVSVYGVGAACCGHT